MKINPNPIILPKIKEGAVNIPPLTEEAAPAANIQETTSTGNQPVVNTATDEQMTELSSLVDKLAEQNQINIVTVDDDLPAGLPEGLTTHSVDGAEVTLYNVNNVVKAQAISNEEVDFTDIYNQIASANNTETSLDANNTSGINGEFDEQIKQGGTGDCWLISGLLALNATDEGKQIIKDSISVNDDGSVTVNFRGVNASYTITPEQIKKYDTDNNTKDAYSNGDNDMLVFELAVKKLKSDIAAGAINIGASANSYEGDRDTSIEGGFAQQVIYFMTGKTSQTYGVQSSNKRDLANGLANSTIYNVLNDAANNPQTVLACGMYYGIKSAKCIDGRTFNIDLREYGHAFAITGVDADKQTVTILNPWDSTKPYTMSWSEFANMGIGMISSTKLDGSGAYVTPKVQNVDSRHDNNNNNSRRRNINDSVRRRSSGIHVRINSGITARKRIISGNAGEIRINSNNLFVNDYEEKLQTNTLKENLAHYLKEKLNNMGIKFDSARIDKILDNCINSDLDKYRELYAEAEIANALEQEIDTAVKIAKIKIEEAEDNMDENYSEKLIDEIEKFLVENIF